MTTNERVALAAILKRLKPDKRTGTIAERRLWVMMVNRVTTGMVTGHGYAALARNRRAFREACGMEATDDS